MKMNMFHSGFCGEKSYQAGIVDVNADHAKQVFVLGHGIPVDDKDVELSFDDACKALRLQDADVATAFVNHNMGSNNDAND